MNKIGMLLAVALASGVSCAGECVWTGGSGTWSDPANWKDGVVPGTGTDSVRFENASEITVTLGATVRVLNVTFGTAKVTITGAGWLHVTGTNAFVDVSEGGTAWIDIISGYGAPAFCKKGAGTLRVTSKVSGFKSFDVVSGKLEIATAADAFNPTALVTVKDGATVETLTANQTQNDVVFWLERGATFVIGAADFFGGVFGEAGAVCRSADGSCREVTWMMSNGPWTTAVAYTNVIVNVRGAATTSSADVQAQRCFVIQSGEAFKFAGISYTGTDGTTVYAPDAVKFAPAIRDFWIGKLSSSRQGVWTLEDTAGEAINLHATFNTSFTTPIAGTGALCVVPKGGWAGAVSTDDNVLSLDALEGFAGEICCGANVTFRSSAAGGPVLPKVKRLSKTVDSVTCNFGVDKPIAFMPPVVGSGWDIRTTTKGGLVTFTSLYNAGLQSMLPYGGNGFVYAGDTRATVKSDNNWMQGAFARQRVEGDARVTFNSLNANLSTDKGQLHTFEVAENGYFKLNGLWNMATDGTKAQSRLRIHGGTLAWNGGDGSEIKEIYPYHTVTFTNKPVRIDTTYDEDPANTIVLSALLRRETDDMSAQAFVKGGAGRLKVTTAQTELTGPVAVRSGMLVSGTDAAGAVFAGDVTLSNATFAIEAGKGVEKTVSPNGTLNYTGLSELRVIGAPVAGDAITVGKAGSTSSALVPSGDGAMLAIRTDVAGQTVGTDFAVKANGGAGNGVVFALAPESGKTYARADLLSYDDTVGFKPATTVAITEAQATDAVRVSTATTLAADTTVGSLILDKAALTVGSGKKLTVGDGTNPALILVNANGNNDNFMGGTLAFGASRGHIVLCGTGYCRVKSSITGSNGVVYGGPGTTTATFFLDSGTGNYTGGTWIENVRVYSWQYDATPFGAENSDVWIVGNAAGGGQFMFHDSYSANITRKYNWHLSGYGVGRTGAIYLNNRTARAINGTLEIADEAMVNIYHGCTLNVNATVYGAGRLVKRGCGRINLNADATVGWTGGLQIEAGTVCVTKAEQLGAGELHVAAGGTLVFENETDITVTNTLSGFGTVDMRGAGRVTFSNAKAFVGKLTTNDGQLMPAEAGAGETCCYSGTIEGSEASYVKEGAGTQILAATNTYGGATVVANGTLVLGSAAAKAFAENVIDGAFCHLDATVAGTVVEKDGTTTHEVRTWKDVKGRYSFTQADEPSHADWLFPQSRDAESGLNGKPTVFFTGFKNRLQEKDGDIKFRTLMLAHRVPSGSHPKGWGNAGVVGAPGSDNGNRVTGGNNAVVWLGEHGYYYVNGCEQMTLPSDEALVSTIVTPETYNIGKAVLGDYWGNASQNRCYWGDIGEVMFFSAPLGASERVAVERYLMEKWGATAAAETTNNVLPATTALEIKPGATLDLNGCDQTVAELSGWGTVVNSGARAVTLTVTSRYAYCGTLPANVKLVLAPGGDEVGTLSVETDLPNATVLCDFGGDEADKIVCSGVASLEDAKLVLRPLAKFTADRIEILAAESVEGEFGTVFGLLDNLRLRYAETTAILSAKHGLLLIVK